MKRLLFVTLLLTGSFLLAQDSYPAGNHQDSNSKGDATVQGCLGRSGGDFILTKQNPAITYQLHGTHKIRLSHYLGQRVEVSGSQTPTMSTSSDAINKTGSAAPVTINVMSIRTIDKECTAR